jgi:16S rRNA (guanine(966)-N(2))-methyltransferase RsmD
MRVIAGAYRSRKLKTVSGLLVRPTPDRLRETLFNVLAMRLPGAVFLDAYAGSGAVGIEAFSRGAKRVILIEQAAEAIAVIRENLASLGIRQGVVVAHGSAVRMLSKYVCDIAFLDPPYAKPNEYGEALAALDGMECPLVVAQHEWKKVMEDRYGGLRKVRVLKQGDNALTFYERCVLDAPIDIREG